MKSRPLRILTAVLLSLAAFSPVGAQLLGPAELSEIDADAGRGGVRQPKSGENNDAVQQGLAIIPFKHVGTIKEKDAGTAIANLLLSEVDSKRYRLFERSQLVSLMEEAKLQATDLVDNAAKAVKFGRLAGIRYMVLGELNRLGGYRLTVRLVDCQTGQIREKGGVKFRDFDEIDQAIAELLALLKLNDAGVGVQPGRGVSPQPGHNDRRPETGQPLTGNDLIDARNPNATFAVKLNTGENKLAYVGGEAVSFEVTAERDCFLTLVTVDSKGDMTLLLPNAWQTRAFVRAGEKVTLPSRAMGFRFTAQAPFGPTRVKVIATTSPLKLRGVNEQRLKREKFVNGGNLADGTKAIGIEGLGGSGVGNGNSQGLADLLNPSTWTAAELTIVTRKLGNERVVAKPRRPIVPPTGGVDPNDAFMKVWQRVKGSASTSASALFSSAEVTMASNVAMEPTAKSIGSQPAKDLLVIRRAAANSKGALDNAGNNNGNGWGYETEVVPAQVAGAKAFGQLGLAGQNLDDRIAQIKRADPTVVAVIPNREMFAHVDITDVPLGAAQWALHNSVNREVDTAWHRVANRLPTSKLPLIGMVDQGLDLSDPRLKAFAWRNSGEVPGNGKDDDGNGLVDDVHGYNFATKSARLSAGEPYNHGSFCASIIAASPSRRQNDMLGIAPGAKIVSSAAMVWDPKLRTARGSTRTIFEGIRYAMNQGARIINLSLGSTPDARRPITAKELAEYNAHPLWDELERRGVLVVIAAGNDNNDNDRLPVLPANLPRPNVITVMAIDPAGRPARGYHPVRKRWVPFTNYGKQSVHIAAPGTAVLGIPVAGKTNVGNGTSFSAPIVAGAAALVWAQHPTWTYGQVKQAILATARPVKGLEQKCQTGGMLDIAAALDFKP